MTKVNTYLFVCYCLTAILSVGCAPQVGAATPAQRTSIDVVLIVAQAVKVSDKLCAQYALDTKEADVARVCMDAYNVARPSLEGIEQSIYGWTDVSDGKFSCVAADVGLALKKYADAFAGGKLALPPLLTEALALLSQFQTICHG